VSESEIVPVWQQPDRYDMATRADRRLLYRLEAAGTEKVLRVHEIADELFELNHPDKTTDTVARERFGAPIVRQGDKYGKWFYFPWSDQLVQYPDEADYRELLTFRNRELITMEEQRKLGAATLACVGLSVGSHIVLQAAHSGIGDTMILADPDVVSIMNLNRIHAGMTAVGMRKTDLVGIAVSELNPYIKQVHLPEGITPGSAKKLMKYQPDLLYEHVDHLPTKVLLRRLARQAGIPLIMATDVGDRSLIDIERYDLGDARPFLGKLNDEELDALEKDMVPADQKLRFVNKIIGEENMSPRMVRSMSRIGISLGGIAQLSTTAGAGGAYAVVAGREILLGRGPASGRYSMSAQDILHIPDVS